MYIKLEFKRHGFNSAHSPHSTRSTCQSFHSDNIRDDDDKNNQVDNNDENYYNDADECAGVYYVDVKVD